MSATCQKVANFWLTCVSEPTQNDPDRNFCVRNCRHYTTTLLLQCSAATHPDTGIGEPVHVEKAPSSFLGAQWFHTCLEVAFICLGTQIVVSWHPAIGGVLQRRPHLFLAPSDCACTCTEKLPSSFLCAPSGSMPSVPGTSVHTKWRWQSFFFNQYCNSRGVKI